MPSWWITNMRSRRQYHNMLQVDLTSGRNAKKKHVRGKIVGRAHVGFEEEDWRYLVCLSKGMGMTISDMIRQCVSDARKDCEADIADDEGTVPIWMTDDWDKGF